VSPRTTGDDPPLEQLRKVLELERRKRYNDSAVYGGLDRFLANLSQRNGLPPDSPLARAIRALPDGGYHDLSVDDRRRWLEAALTALRGSPPPPKPAPRPRAPAPRAQPPGLDAPVTVLKGVKAAMAEKFEKLNVHTVRDLLYLFPRRHNDFAKLRKIAELTPGEEETVRARVWSANETQLGMRKGAEADVGDESGMMHVVWFNQPWIARTLRTNQEIVLAGRVALYKGRPTFENPEWEPWTAEEELTHTGRLVPVYPLTSGITNRTLRKLIRQTLDAFVEQLADPLPESLRARLQLIDVRTAVRQAHYPDNQESLAQARRRLALDELLPLQVSVLLRRRLWQQPGTADPLPMSPQLLDGFLASLPFALTRAQRKALDQLLADLSRDAPMSRLLQGDVGSGKTVVAAAGLVAAAANGAQGVMMAPTEILAEQHFRTLCALFGAPDAEGPLAQATPSYLDRPLRIARPPAARAPPTSRPSTSASRPATLTSRSARTP
jgi:ATP-dependent DNA helicase RecG